MIKEVLFANGIPILGLIVDIVEDTILRLETIKTSEVYKIFFLLKLLFLH